MMTILVVDDDQRTRELVGEALKPVGFNVLSAASAEEAAVLLNREVVHLIILDLLLPGKNGWVFAEELKFNARTAAMPVLVASILSPDDTGVQKQNSNVVGYILKPLDADDLTARVKAVFTRNR
ncbi:MAG: response regulator [Elusimicrobia bacterium]|nr:response regulator [Elusimicrobiota bacterium]